MSSEELKKSVLRKRKKEKRSPKAMFNKRKVIIITLTNLCFLQQIICKDTLNIIFSILVSMVLIFIFFFLFESNTLFCSKYEL